MSPLISVIIPAYNAQAHLARCLDSVLAQTFLDFEVIVIDDGSVDGTAELSDAYALRDCRITVLHQENQGVSAARNAGIAQASGCYIFFFDADDFAEPETFAEVSALAKETEADTVLYGYHRFHDGRVVETCPPVFPEGVYTGGAIVEKLLARFIGISFEGIDRWLCGDSGGIFVENPALWRAMLSLERINANGLAFDTRLKIGEDTVFISDYLSCSRRCAVTSKCYYHLVLWEDSTISRYERDPYAKLEGKMRLLDAREALTLRVAARGGADIRRYWAGTVVLSAIEMAFQLSRKGVAGSFADRYRAFMRYAGRHDVRARARMFSLGKKLSVRAIPFLMAKMGMYPILFFCAALLNAVGYRFDRNAAGG